MAHAMRRTSSSNNTRVELARTAEVLKRRADSGPVKLGGHGPDALRRAEFFVNEAQLAVRRAREVLQEDDPVQ